MTSSAQVASCAVAGPSRVKLLRVAILTTGLAVGGLLGTWTAGNWNSCTGSTSVVELQAEFQRSLAS